MKFLDGFLTASKNQKILFSLSIVFITILIYIFNSLFPVMIDDWNYTFVYGTDFTHRVSSISDIITSQYNHYFTWGGRSVVHSIAQFLLMLDPIWQDILNTLAFVLLMLYIFRISNFGRPLRSGLFILLTIFMWFLQPGFAGVFFWITGSANYLWGTLIILFFLYPYYSYYRKPKGSNNILRVGLFLIAGVITGWCNENMSFGIIAFIICFFYFLKQNKNKIPVWSICGLIGVLIGTIIMLKAPGNYLRYIAEARAEGIDDSIFSITKIIVNIPNILQLYLKRLLWMIIPYFVLYYYIAKSKKQISCKKQVLFCSLLFFIAGNVAFFAMIGSPGFPTRAFFGVITFLLIANGILIANLNYENIRIYKIFTAIVIIAITGFTVDYMSRYNTFSSINKLFKDREVQIEKGKSFG